MPDFTIEKEFSFSAAHALPLLPVGHKCHRLHGHNYRVRIRISSRNLNRCGFVVDYGELGWFREMIRDEFDHRNLNDVLDIPTSAENLAAYFWDRVALWGADFLPDDAFIEVGVSETANTWAWCRID